jgi:capsular exopolysaccharide synthesis family protein
VAAPENLDRPPDAGHTLREYAGAVWKRRGLVLALGVLGVAAGWWQGTRSPDVYAVSTRIDIAKQRPFVTNQQISTGEAYHESQLYYPTRYALLASRTYVDKLFASAATAEGRRFPMWDWLTWPAYGSRAPALDPAQSLGPPVLDVHAFEAFAGVSAAEFARRFQFRRYGASPSASAAYNDPDELAETLANKVVVQPEKGTTLVTIELEGERHEVLAPLLNLLIEVFWREQRSETQRRLEKELETLEQQHCDVDGTTGSKELAGVTAVVPGAAGCERFAPGGPHKGRLAVASEQLEEWKKSNAASANSLNLQQQYRATQRIQGETQLRDLEERLVTSEPDFEALVPTFDEERKRAEAAVRAAAPRAEPPTSEADLRLAVARAVDVGWQDALVAVQQEAEKTLAGAVPTSRFHGMGFVTADPAFATPLLRLQTLLGDGSSRADVLDPVRKVLNATVRDAVLRKVRDLRRDLGLRVLARDRIRDDDGQLRQQWLLSAELAVKQKAVDDLVVELAHIDDGLKRVNGQLAIENDSRPLKVILSAEDPGKPVKPNRPLLIILGAGIGLLLGFSLALLVDWLDDTVADPDDVLRHVGVPVVGTILSLPGKVADRVAVEMPRSPVAEAFRAVRTSIEFTGIDDKPGGRVLLVTSCSPREGKTTVAANLAFALAQDGKRTLLVDADLRKPRVHQVVNVDPTIGLSNVIVGRTRPDDAVVGTTYENLWVLPAGALPPNPAELLGRAGTKALFDALRLAFDRIVVDTPPVGVVTDAAVLARHADQVLLVVAAGRTKKSAAEHGASVLRSVGSEPVGVVMNLVSKGSRWAYGGYYHRDAQSYYGSSNDAGASK